MPRPPNPAGTTADKILAVRLTPADFALVGELVTRHQAELLKAGLAGQSTPASLVRTLLRKEAERLGVAVPAADAATSRPPAKKSTKAQPKPPSPPAKKKPTQRGKRG